MSSATITTTDVTTDDEFRSLIPPLTDAERFTLERSLIAEGCRNPLAVWKGNHLLLDGYHRIDICNKHGIGFCVTEVDLSDRVAAKSWIIRNQLARRNLMQYQRAELALHLEPLIAKQAKDKQREAGGALPQKSAKPPVDTRKEVAKAAGVSHDTIAKVKRIDADADKETKAKLRTGATTINREYNKLVQAERKDRQLRAVTAAELPVGKYYVIVADPPWLYGKRPDDVTHRGRCPYPPMTTDEIKALDVAALAHDDCILWLWATNAHMEEAHQVARAWGFDVKTILTWKKDRMGVGDWLRGQTEHCLMCVKGRPVINLTNQTTIIEGAAREHSRKPKEFYSLIESLCPGKKVELFAREKRDGWESHGAEQEMFTPTRRPTCPNHGGTESDGAAASES